METVIASDCVNLFVDLLDKIGPTPKISLLLHTNGGDTLTAWRLVNLIRSFADELEVIISLKALSSGTLISLGADRLIMTKQAVLGPIDPKREWASESGGKCWESACASARQRRKHSRLS